MLKSIILIDDYPINHTISEIILRHHGHFDHPKSFLEAEKALGYLISSKNDISKAPDFIMLDLDMPVIDGWHFLDMYEDIRPLMCKSPSIYILTTSRDEDDMRRSKLYPSVKGFFSRPLNVQMLCHMIENEESGEKSHVNH